MSVRIDDETTTLHDASKGNLTETQTKIYGKRRSNKLLLVVWYWALSETAAPTREQTHPCSVCRAVGKSTVLYLTDRLSAGRLETAAARLGPLVVCICGSGAKGWVHTAW